MRKQAIRQVERAAARIPRTVEAIIRFEEDGITKRVTLSLRAPRHHDIMGKAEGRFYGPAITAAIAKVMTQVNREKRETGHASAHAAARSKRAAR
jgi:ribosome-associated translation inhibitor RaiA